MTNLGRRDIDPSHQRDYPSGATGPTIRAMQSRTLVRCGLVDADTFRVEASDGEVLLHHVERDEQGNPITGQIDRWLNLLRVPSGMDAVLNETAAPSRNCSQSRETRVDSRSGRTDKRA
jgi:hypothetical protein